MEAVRPSDAPGAGVGKPTEEVFPGGGPAEPWHPAGHALELPYAAGGAFAAATGQGELQVSLDGGPERALAVAGPGLYKLAEHERHSKHRLDIRVEGEIELYSIAFAAAPP